MGIQYSLRRGRLAPRYRNDIRRYRIEAGLTQAMLARAIGKNRQSISDWERGRTLPTLPNGIQLARTLGTLAESLYWDFYSNHPRR